MPNSVLFYLIFISQIWLLSYFYPRKILERIRFVIQNYPPQQYPKLYPQSLDKVERVQKIYKFLNYIILAIGIWLLVGLGMLSNADNQDNFNEGIPLMYGMVQFIPMMMLEVLGYKQFKLMKQKDTRTNRKAELQPRRLFAYVSPYLIISAVVMYIFLIAFELYMTQYTITFDFMVKVGSVSLANLLFIGITLFNLFGKKLDPYQATEERIKQTKFAIRSMAFISIFVSFFMVAQTLVNTYELGTVEIMINSLYFQVLAIFSIGRIIKNFKIEDIDFDVYKAESN